MLGSSMNQPFGLPSDYVNDAELNPNNLTQARLFNVMAAEEGKSLHAGTEPVAPSSVQALAPVVRGPTQDAPKQQSRRLHSRKRTKHEGFFFY